MAFINLSGNFIRDEDELEKHVSRIVLLLRVQGVEGSLDFEQLDFRSGIDSISGHMINETELLAYETSYVNYSFRLLGAGKIIIPNKSTMSSPVDVILQCDNDDIYQLKIKTGTNALDSTITLQNGTANYERFSFYSSTKTVEGTGMSAVGHFLQTGSGDCIHQLEFSTDSYFRPYLVGTVRIQNRVDQSTKANRI